MQPLGVGAVGASVGPLVLQGLDEALGLAVRLRAVGPGVPQCHASGGVSIARVYRPPVATVIRPPGQPVGRLGISEQYVSSISSFLGVEQRAVRREPLAVALALDHDLVAGVGEPVECAVAEDRVVEEAEPLLDGAVRGDDEARAAVAPDNQLVEVDRLLCAEPVQPEVVEDQQVGGEEAAEGLLGGVVDPCLRQLAEVLDWSAVTKRTLCPERTAA